jgi:hypothetical protein
VGFKDFFGHEMKHMVRELGSGNGPDVTKQ